MRTICEKTGRPPNDYTNFLWQKDFIQIKSVIPPSSLKKMMPIPKAQNFTGSYQGDTQYQYYRSFINDVLSNIRNGKADYCYYIYQIAEILKYENNKLQAVWLEKERCFKISLLNKTE